MKEILPNIFAVEVPEDAKGFETSVQPDKIPCVTYWYKENPEPTVISIRPGSYEILFTTKDCTEEHAASILPIQIRPFDEAEKRVFQDYGTDEFYDNANQSLRALLRYKMLLDKNYLLLKKIP